MPQSKTKAGMRQYMAFLISGNYISRIIQNGEHCILNIDWTEAILAQNYQIRAVLMIYTF